MEILNRLPIELSIKILMMANLNIICDMYDILPKNIQKIINNEKIYKKVIIHAINYYKKDFYCYEYLFNHNKKSQIGCIYTKNNKKYYNNIQIGLYKTITVPLTEQLIYYNIDFQFIDKANKKNCEI